MCGRNQSKTHLHFSPFYGGTVGGQKTYRRELSLKIEECPYPSKRTENSEYSSQDHNLQQDCDWVVPVLKYLTKIGQYCYWETGVRGLPLLSSCLAWNRRSQARDRTYRRNEMASLLRKHSWAQSCKREPSWCECPAYWDFRGFMPIGSFYCLLPPFSGPWD